MSRRDLLFERRSESRIPCDLTCSIQRVEKQGGLAHAVDLSPGGIRFQHMTPEIALDEKILVQFTLGRSTFSLCGRTVRRTRLDAFAQEIALTFAAIDPRARDRLRASL